MFLDPFWCFWIFFTC